MLGGHSLSGCLPTAPASLPSTKLLGSKLGPFSHTTSARAEEGAPTRAWESHRKEEKPDAGSAELPEEARILSKQLSVY